MTFSNTTPEAMVMAEVEIRKIYDGNIRMENFKTLNTKKTRFSFTLKANDSKKFGARVSHSGRRLTSASWHAHRDFMRAVYKTSPNTIISTGMATYRGKEDFERSHEETGNKNIGSMVEPMAMADTSLALDGSKPF